MTMIIVPVLLAAVQGEFWAVKLHMQVKEVCLSNTCSFFVLCTLNPWHNFCCWSQTIMWRPHFLWPLRCRNSSVPCLVLSLCHQGNATQIAAVFPVWISCFHPFAPGLLPLFTVDSVATMPSPCAHPPIHTCRVEQLGNTLGAAGCRHTECFAQVFSLGWSRSSVCGGFVEYDKRDIQHRD